ncbi:AAA family ATPase [Amycolatopsis echigonensis]|uniref:AAA family ATPase n=1 Tax=Amycolatopsis echigonensis TaxID=2576905 RepID=A0A8E2B7Y8_9PSEU|nr:LuxR family transcriptional regulator [Amycolatopsis echigonensis]MBB2504436.1 AAA family ATPase [Amycolatopsis echigonensis]
MVVTERKFRRGIADPAGRDDPERGSAVTGEWPLVGRTDALRRLRETLTGPGDRGVVLAGSLGVGKSRLAAEGLHLAARAGLPTARASATRSSSGIPFGALAPLLPSIRQAEAGAVDDRADLLRRCTAALVERGEGRRLVLLVDDAHLLDDMSATLIHQLADTRAVQILATVRSCEQAPDPVVALWKDGLAERVEVEGLGPDAVAEVLSWVLGGPVDDAAIADLARRSEGNMLFLRELVMGALAEGVLCNDGGVWRFVGEQRPTDRLVELIEARLAGLAPDERALMETVSFGEPLGPAELAALGDLSVAETLERSGLLVSRLDGRRVSVALAHPLYGEVLRARMPVLRARSIARSLAEAVEATGARRREDVLRVATWRLVGGGARPELMLEAATVARWRYDFPLAERLARAALDAGGGFDAELLVAQLACLQGRFAEAAPRLAALAEMSGDAEQRARVALTRLDNRVIYDGTINEGLKIAEAEEAALRGTPRHDQIAARRVALLLATEGPGSAAAAAEPLLRNATGQAPVWACMPGSYSLTRTGRIEAALEAADRGRAAQLALTEPMDWYPWMHLFYRGEALAQSGRFAEAEALAAEQYQAGLADRSVEAQAMFSWQLAKTVADRGQVARAVRRAQTAIAIYRQLGRPQFVEFCLIYLALAHAIGRQPAEAAAALTARDELGITCSYFMGVDLQLARGWTEIASGNFRRAQALFGEAADEGERIGDLVGAAAALHGMARIGHAKEIAGRLGDVAAGIEGPLPAARAAHARALADGDPEALERVSRTFEDMDADLLGAEAAADAAVAWQRKGERRCAAAAERRSAWLAARCEGADTPALQGAQLRVALTSAEWETAQLASAGRSNKEIAEHLVVSVRTVENRLQHVYGKLGVSGRAELADALKTIHPAG